MSVNVLENFYREPRFREDSHIKYPPFCQVYFEKYFYEYIQRKYQANELDKDVYDRYLPVFWTEIQISPRYDATVKTRNKTEDNLFIWQLWELLKYLPEDKTYFTVVQHDDGIMISSKPSHLFTFGMGGVGNVPIPLTYDDSATLDRYKGRNKSVFCSFVGSLTHPLRERMVRVLENRPDVFIVTGAWTNDIGKENQTRYLNVMSQSRYTLAPRGYGKTSFRLYEALRLGSIPIYIYDEPWLPYTEWVDWTQMAVLVHVDDLETLYDRIREITDEQVAAMLAYYEQHSHLFTYDGMCEYIINSSRYYI